MDRRGRAIAIIGIVAQRTIHAFIRRGERQHVAECVEIAVVTQGQTLDETIASLREAVALHLDGEDLGALGLSEDPSAQRDDGVRAGH